MRSDLCNMLPILWFMSKQVIACLDSMLHTTWIPCPAISFPLCSAPFSGTPWELEAWVSWTEVCQWHPIRPNFEHDAVIISRTSKNTEQFQSDLEIEVIWFSAFMPGPLSSWPLKVESDFPSAGFDAKFHCMKILWDVIFLVYHNFAYSRRCASWACLSRQDWVLELSSSESVHAGWQPWWTLSILWTILVHFQVTFKTYTHEIESQYLLTVCSKDLLSHYWVFTPMIQT